MSLHLSGSVYSPIKLGESGKVPNEVQVLRVGSFKHPQYGAFDITKQTLSEMKANFDSHVRGIDMAFDYYHASDQDASAWVQSLELREDDTQLWAIVDWTPKAAQKLAEREVRYFSPDFSFKWKDPESGKEYRNVLFGGGLTNRPFVKEMKAIVAAENKGDTMKTELEKSQEALKLAEDKVIKLSEQVGEMEKKLASGPSPEKIAELESKIAELMKELEAEKAKGETLLKEKQAADEAKVLAEKEKNFNVLLSEGKAVAAQKDSYIKGDMETFIKLSQPVNLKGSGSTSSVAGDDKEAKILKLAEEKVKADSKLPMHEAISIAKKEIEASK